MPNYVDGFVLPVRRDHLEEYMGVANEVAKIWREHGALDYREFVGDDLYRDGTNSFADLLSVSKDEVVVFGWVEFDSRESRDLANGKVETDPRMPEIVAPLLDPSDPVFDPGRMSFGGFGLMTRSSG